MSQIAKKNLLARMWCWLLPMLLCLGGGTLLAHPTVAHVRVKIYVSDTDNWCCGDDWLGRCNCRRREAYNLRVNGFGQEWQVAGTFYGGRWYEATFYNVNQDWPTFRANLGNVRFFNTDRNWVIGHTAVTVWAVGGQVIRDHDTDVGDYWVGAWNNFWFSSVLWNYNYDTPPDVSISSTTPVTMDWNAGRTFLKRITLVDPDGCYNQYNFSLSNPALGDLSVTQAGCSGKTSYLDLYLTPKPNAFGSSTVTFNSLNAGATVATYNFTANVNRVGLPPTFSELKQNQLVRADHSVALKDVFKVNDEYTYPGNLKVECISTSSDVIPAVGSRLSREHPPSHG